jgi:hypothetical protein
MVAFGSCWAQLRRKERAPLQFGAILNEANNETSQLALWMRVNAFIKVNPSELARNSLT